MSEESIEITVQETIIRATIACIEEFGLNGATNRRIAAKAGVNIAAINYYFRSKQVLLDTVMDITLDNAFDWDDLMHLPGTTALEWCTEIFVDLLLGARNYPNLTRAHFQEVLIDGNYTTPGARRMQAFLVQLVEALIERGVKTERQQIEQAAAQLGMSFISAALVPHFFENTFGIDLTEESQVRAFYGSMVQKLLGE
jgi:AcrR family transcriptional regulator